VSVYIKTIDTRYLLDIFQRTTGFQIQAEPRLGVGNILYIHDRFDVKHFINMTEMTEERFQSPEGVIGRK
jgi:hypothetical protein